MPSPDSSQSSEIDSATWRMRDASVTGSVSFIGLNAFSADGGFLTFLDHDHCEQPYVTREDLEWMRDVGIPGWLREMEGR